MSKTSLIHNRRHIKEGESMFAIGLTVVPADMVARWAKEFAEHRSMESGYEVCKVELHVDCTTYCLAE